MPDDWYRRRGRARRMLLRPVRFLINPQSPKVVVAVVVVLAVLAGAAWRFQSQIPYLHRLFHPGPVAAAEQSPDATMPPTSSHPNDPFWGTPAASFPTGETGLTLPALTSAGDFSTDEVLTGLGLVTGVLTTGHLDPRVIVQHHDETLLGLFPPDERASLRKTITEHSGGAGLFVHIDPASTLASVQPRVQGSMTYRAVTDEAPNGDRVPVLEITTNYVWVYPFAGRTAQPGDHLVISHEQATWWVFHDGDLADSSSGLWFRSGSGYLFGMDCAAAGKDLLKPRTPLDPSANPDATSSEPPAAYYRPDHPIDTGDNGCR